MSRSGHVFGNWSALVLCAALSGAVAAQVAPPKGTGQVAPKLTAVEWERGTAVKQFARGTIYVLVFWSPSSAESLRSLGLLDTLAKQNAAARVQFVGVTVKPQPGTVPLKTFLEQRKAVAGSLDFPMARDKVDGTFDAWSKIIDLSAIPRCVVIDRKGKIAWVGQPFDGLEEALPAVVAEDAPRLDALVAARDTIRTGAKPHLETLQKEGEKERWSKLPPEVDALLALDSRLFSPYATIKYQALVTQKHREPAAAWGRSMLDTLCHDDAMTLNELAWYIVGDSSKVPADQRDLPLALDAARRADELCLSKDAAVLDTLAHAHAALGEFTEAIDCETRAAAAAYSGDLRDQLTKQRTEWVAAAAAPKAKPAAAASGTPAGAPAAPAPATPGAAPALPPLPPAAPSGSGGAAGDKPGAAPGKP